jgi:serine/threonine protein kinase
MNRAARTAAFHSWSPPEALGRELGRGKYGVVRLAGRGAVAKVVEVGPKPASALAFLAAPPGEERAKVPWRRTKQAYREHVLGLLQSLLVMRGLTPHVVMHFGARVAPSPGACRVTLFMEQFEGSLEQHGPQLLRDETDWRALLFQVSSALAALGTLLGVVHNDLYPRNVLFRRLDAARDEVYDICGTSYQLTFRTCFALTDFGICGSPLLDSAMDCCPEVTVPQRRRPRHFGLWKAQHHVLSYCDLPTFSRDLYLAFKWPVQPSDHLPRAPEATRAWATKTLSFIDDHPGDFQEPQGLLAAIRVSFEVERLRGARAERPPEVHRFGPEDREPLLVSGMQLLRSMPFDAPGDEDD